MTDDWKPDIVDYNCFDDDKAGFIYEAASAYLETTLIISDTLDDRIFRVLGFVVTALSAIIGYMLLKCDFAVLVCKIDGNDIFWPSATLLVGMATSGFVLAYGAFRHQPYALPGNQPHNLIRNDVCSMSATHMKISEATGLESRIKNNLANLDRTAKRLRLGVKIALCSLVMAACVAVITATPFSPQKRQTPPSSPSAAAVSGR